MLISYLVMICASCDCQRYYSPREHLISTEIDEVRFERMKFLRVYLQLLKSEEVDDVY